MDDKAKEILEKSKPWRSDAQWEVVAIEAVLVVAVGAFILINPDGARDAILQIIGVALLVAGFQQATLAVRGDTGTVTALDAFRSGIGVTVGVIATVSWWSNYIDNSAVRVILGWGLIVFALLQLLGLFTAQGRAGFRVSALIASGLTFVLGIILLTSDDTTTDGRLTMLGVTFLVFGLLLGGLAYILRSQRNN